LSHGRVVRKTERVRIYGPQSAKQGPGEKFSGLGRRGLPRIGFELIAKAIPRSGYGATPQRQPPLPAFFCQISCAILSWFALPSCVTLNSAVYSSYNPLTGFPVRKINNN
jgi:hypothetical protein